MADTVAPRPVLVLASASPARAALLRSSGIEPVILPSDVDEAALASSMPPDPHAVTVALAHAKAVSVASLVRHGELLGGAAAPGAPGSPSAPRQGAPTPRALVVGADSMLQMDGQLLGKAASADEVRARWARMAGGRGQLVTGHVLIEVGTGRTLRASVSTEVRFGRPDPDELEAYIASGEPLEVAGSCTIDGLGAAFIDGVDGDHTNVIGLSLPTLRSLLRGMGVRWTELWVEGRVLGMGGGGQSVG